MASIASAVERFKRKPSILLDPKWITDACEGQPWGQIYTKLLTITLSSRLTAEGVTGFGAPI